MSEELLMQETQPEVNAETTDVETADADTEATRGLQRIPSPQPKPKQDEGRQTTETEGRRNRAQANPAEPGSEPEPPVVCQI